MISALACRCGARIALVLAAKKELNPRCFFNSALAKREISFLPAKGLGEVVLTRAGPADVLEKKDL
jgi:hypothetical protein